MRRTFGFVLLLTATVLFVGCTKADNSNMAGNANVVATPANANTGTANTNNANANVMGNTNMGNMNMSNKNMSNMNMGKKANANKTP